MRAFWRQGLAIVLVVGLIGAAVGIVAAQTGSESTPAPTDATPEAGATPAKERPFADFLARLAENLDVSEQELQDAFKQTALELLDEAVADETIPKDVADRIREGIESGKGMPFGPGFGFGRPHGFGEGRPFGDRFGHLGASLDALGTFLGVSVDDLRSEVKEGQSPAQIAEAHGKSRAELRAFMLAEVEERLNQKVEDGDITQERADELLKQAPEHIDTVIDREGRPFSHPFKFGPR